MSYNPFTRYERISDEELIEVALGSESELVLELGKRLLASDISGVIMDREACAKMMCKAVGEECEDADDVDFDATIKQMCDLIEEQKEQIAKLSVSASKPVGMVKCPGCFHEFKTGESK